MGEEKLWALTLPCNQSYLIHPTTPLALAPKFSRASLPVPINGHGLKTGPKPL